jgi:hypothetical protein
MWVNKKVGESAGALFCYGNERTHSEWIGGCK